jgi:integrase/recombinase XerD
MSFRDYRLKKGYAPSSLRVQDSHLRRFSFWSGENGIDMKKISYENLLGFIDHERARGISPGAIATAVNSIRIYYDYLIQEGIAQENILKKIRIRDRGNKVLPEIFYYQKLEQFFEDYSNRPSWKHPSARAALLHQRNTAVLGFLIFQGLLSGNVARLEIGHVDLEKSTVYIASDRKTNARILPLKAAQVLSLKTYLEEIRPCLLKDLVEESPLLFVVQKHSEMVRRIIKEVKRQHPEVTGTRQMRASMIIAWLKNHNMRQVQYMAGHKSIRTTESFRRQDLSGLARQLELFHPLKF